jgi:4-hydroxy-tetrahydrodipicolinate synthase
MTSDLDLRGVWIPLITPFDENDVVDIPAVERLVDEYVRAGARGIVALGTTGESTALDAGEKRAVIEACSRACAVQDAPMIVGVGTNNTRATIEAAQSVAGTPAAVAVLVVTPYYVRPSTEGIVAHFRAVAAASSLPVVIYNIPYRTGRVIDADAMIELSRVPGIAGVKQAVGGIDMDTLRILAGADRSFQLLGGDDPYLYPAALMGAAGAICASAHVCTERFVEMIECGLAGKLEDGRAHAEALLPVVEALFAEPNPAVLKGVLHANGRIATADLRLPMTNGSPAAVDRALAAIAAVP